MIISDFNQRITLQSPTTTKTNGVSATTWTTVVTAWAAIKQLRGFALANAQTVWPGGEYRITIRYRAGITGDMRAVGKDGTIYSILGAPNDIDGKHEFIEMICQAGAKAK
ncbi:MAG: phage head closure protein [Smithella sp.]